MVKMVESVADVIHDIFPAYVSDKILTNVMTLNKEELNNEIKKVSPKWFHVHAYKTFLCFTTYAKSGILAYAISSALNKRCSTDQLLGGPKNLFYIQPHTGEYYPGGFKKKNTYDDEYHLFKYKSLTRKDLVNYLTDNGFSRNFLISRKNDELFALTQSF